MWHSEVLGTFKGMKYFDPSKFNWDDSDKEVESLPKLDEVLNDENHENVISQEEEKKEELLPKEEIVECVPEITIVAEKDLDFKPIPPLTSRKAPPAPLRAKSKIRPSTSAVSRGDIFDQKLRESNQAFQQFMQQFQNGENALNEKLVRRMTMLVEKQKEELKNHDFDWKFGNLAKLYQKESQNLRSLKQQYELMLKLHLVDEAKEMQRIIEREKMIEQKENKEAHTKAFLASRHKLEMKHSQERRIATQYADEKRMVFNAIQNQNSQAYIRRQAILRNAMKKSPINTQIRATKSKRILYRAKIQITESK